MNLTFKLSLSSKFGDYTKFIVYINHCPHLTNTGHMFKIKSKSKVCFPDCSPVNSICRLTIYIFNIYFFFYFLAGW